MDRRLLNLMTGYITLYGYLINEIVTECFRKLLNFTIKMVT